MPQFTALDFGASAVSDAVVGPAAAQTPVAAARPRAELVRVLHVVNGEYYSGAERVQDLLAQRLPDEGFEVGFVCLKPKLFPELRRARASALYEVPMRTRFDFCAAWRIAKIVRDEGYQLVHAHTPRSAMIARPAAWLAGVPMVYHVHSPTSRDTTHRLRNWANARMERWGLRGVSRLIAVSESLGRHMEKAGWNRSRISVVPNGVPRVATLLNRTPPLDRWTIGTVALFRPRKGTEVLLEALAILDGQGLPVRLRAVGPFETPEYEAELKQRVGRLGLADLVQWTGFAEDVGAELSRIDLFVLPSLFGEGMPMVVLEAMAAGVPVVATDVEGIAEAIRDGRDGLIVPPGDPRELARAIGQILRGEVDWMSLRASALERQAACYSDASMAAGVAAAYRAVLGLSPPDGKRG